MTTMPIPFPSEPITSMAMLKKLQKIGKGSYGDVFTARVRSSGTVVVVKEVSLVGISKDEERDILNETQVMLQVEHKNVIRFVASFVETGTLHIVMDLASGGDLAAAVRSYAASGRHIEEETLWTYLIQLTEGLQHLHSRRILHRDIKASNIFIDADGSIKIGDLGLGKILTGNAQCAQSKVGTPLYFSPEICEGKPYDTKSDVWALGCLLHELATLRPPFHAQNQIALAKKIVNEHPDVRVPSRYSKELQFIIGKMLEKDPRKRPSPESLLNYSAVQIRVDRAKFREREQELLGMVQLEREQGRRSMEELASAMERIRALAKEKEEDSRSRSAVVEELMQRIAMLETRCEGHELEKAETARAHEEAAKARGSREGELDRWAEDLAKRELKLLQSEAVGQKRQENHQEQGALVQRVLPCTPLEAEKLSRSGGRIPVPTPTDLFPTPSLSVSGGSHGEEKRRNPPSTPLRMNSEGGVDATPGGSSRPPGTPIVDGYIRARARTPLTSLGPPKRVAAMAQEELTIEVAAEEGDRSRQGFDGEHAKELALSAHRTWGSFEQDSHDDAAKSPSCSSGTRAKSNFMRPPMAAITNVPSAHKVNSAQNGIVTETGERILAASAAKARHRMSSDALRDYHPSTDTTGNSSASAYEGCSPQVEYILAYTDRMRQAAQQAIESCATSSSGSSSGSDKKAVFERLSLAGGSKDDDTAKPRRKLFFSGGGHSEGSAVA